MTVGERDLETEREREREREREGDRVREYRFVTWMTALI